MATVGLLYVGAILYLNGLMLLGRVDPRSAAPLNLFVGALQVVTPTVLVIQADGDPKKILAASGLYLFGFTYLYVGINLFAGLDGTGVGWFSLFVAVAACGYSFLNFRILHDTPFGVIWLYWAFLWGLFFMLLGLKIEWLQQYTGAVTLIEGVVTGAIPAILILGGYWVHDTATAIALGIFGVVVAIGLYPLTAHRPPRAPAVAGGYAPDLGGEEARRQRAGQRERRPAT